MVPGSIPRGKTTDEGTVAIMVSELEKYTYVNVMTEVYTGLSTQMGVDEGGRAVPDGEYPLCEDGGAFLMLDILITKMVEVILMFNILFMKMVELFLVQNTLFTKIIEIFPNTKFPFHKNLGDDHETGLFTTLPNPRKNSWETWFIFNLRKNKQISHTSAILHLKSLFFQ
jgi:hypothetical protein